MNGFSLLLVLAAVGVEFGWEQTSGNKLVYTIRIESVLLEQLRDGSAIESVVDQNDRGLRKFRIAMGLKTQQNDRAAATTANEVTYGWRPNSDGSGLDYYVQITPERLETLNKGIPLDCEVHPDVPAIQRIYVFVGTSELPRENLFTQPKPAAGSQPQQFAATTNTQSNANNSNVTTTGATDSRVGTPRYNDSGFRSDTGTQTAANTNSAATNSAASKNFNQTSPAVADRWSQVPTALSNNGSSGTQLTRDYGTNNTTTGQTLPVPDLNRNTSPTQTYSNDPYGQSRYLNDPYAARTDLAQQNAAAAAALQNQANQQLQNYSPPLNQQTLAAQQLAQQQLLAQQQQQLLAQSQASLYPTQTTPPTWNTSLSPAVLQTAALQPAAAQPAAAVPTTAVAAQMTLATEKEKESAEVKPWTPLILTTLGLFASIAANAYLGWLAWSFFWRYRDSASDLARARTAATSVRQAA